MPRRLFVSLALSLALFAGSRPAAAQYSIVDLGAINGGADSSANAVNSAGHIVGGAYDVNGLQHAVMWTNGAVTDLGTLCDGCASTALGVNDNDQVVGVVTMAGGQDVGFILTNGVMTALPPLAGDARSYAYAINNLGVAVGQSVNASGFSAPVRWIGGVAEPLGSLGGPFGAAFDINDQDQIVGYSGLPDGSIHGFIWQNGVITDLGGSAAIGPCGDISSARGINNSGVVVGYTVENCIYTGFRWSNGVREALPQLGPANPYSMPSKINGNGDIVGNATLNNGQGRAALWTNGNVIDLGSVISSSLALDINDDGAIVGRSQMLPNGANERAVQFVPLPPDTIPPTSTHTVFGSPNALGWYSSGPLIQIQATDNPGGEGVQSITYSLSGAQNESQTVFGSSAQVSVFNQGITTVTYYATDNAGNVEGPHSFVVQLDYGPPMVLPIANITVNATSSAGAVVDFTVNASDSGSGIASIVATPKSSGATFPHGITNETVTVTDVAGNVATRFFTVTVNKSLVSINVTPSTATVDIGQGQQFQAIGHFTDGSTLILSSTSSSGGGGSGAATNLLWNTHFDDALNVTQCAAGTSFSSQALTAGTTYPASVSTDWGSPQTVHVAGSLDASQVSLTLTCINGQGSPGSLMANWTGTRYEGTWNFSGATGHVTVRGWSPKAPAPTSRFSIGAATVNGVVYVMGRDNPSLPAPVEAYDIASNTWSTVSLMPTSREGAAYAVLNGKIYAAGGHIAGGGATDSVDVFDPATNTWSSATPMSMPRAQFALVATGGLLYAIGGETGANGAPLTNTVEAYDPATDTWTPRAPMGAARKFHVAGAVIFSTGTPTIVVAGGLTTGSTTEYYNTATNGWAPGVPPPSPIAGGGAVVINNAMFVVGGTANGGSSRVQMFRPGIPSSGGNPGSPAGWAVPGDMPTPRGELAVAAAGGSSDTLFAIGGLRNGTAVSNVEAMSTPPPMDLSVGGSCGSCGGFVPPTVSWSSSNPAVATINANGQALSLASGQATMIVAAGSISCQATGTCGSLIVNQPQPVDCAHIVLAVTPVGSLPFTTIDVQVEGEGDTHQAPLGEIEFDAEPGSYTFHFFAPAGYRVTPDTISFTVACGDTAHLNVTVEAEDHTPPVLTLPSNITVPAMGPTGATVSFTATAVDAVDGPRAVACVPASGTLFAIGVTTVNCTASDSHGNASSGSFTVTVLSGAQIVARLIAALDDFHQGSNLLNNVLKSLNNGNTGAACNQLGAFINQVQAQAGKQLTQAKAAELTELASQARMAVGCS